jgi:hypothetical protein
MTESVQPVAGSLSAIVQRACQQPNCPCFGQRDCPDHSRTEDLGVIASFDNRKPQDTTHG